MHSGVAGLADRRFGLAARHCAAFMSYLLGKFGDAQIGPVYLGTTGFACL